MYLEGNTTDLIWNLPQYIDQLTCNHKVTGNLLWFFFQIK